MFTDDLRERHTDRHTERKKETKKKRERDIERDHVFSKEWMLHRGRANECASESLYNKRESAVCHTCSWTPLVSTPAPSV